MFSISRVQKNIEVLVGRLHNDVNVITRQVIDGGASRSF